MTICPSTEAIGTRIAQIEDEIASNGWIHCEPDVGLIFDSVAGQKWPLAIAKLGAGLSGFSSDAGRA